MEVNQLEHINGKRFIMLVYYDFDFFDYSEIRLVYFVAQFFVKFFFIYSIFSTGFNVSQQHTRIGISENPDENPFFNVHIINTRLFYGVMTRKQVYLKKQHLSLASKYARKSASGCSLEPNLFPWSILFKFANRQRSLEALNGEGIHMSEF